MHFHENSHCIDPHKPCVNIPSSGVLVVTVRLYGPVPTRVWAAITKLYVLNGFSVSVSSTSVAENS